jgi:hypothetical protein
MMCAAVRVFPKPVGALKHRATLAGRQRPPEGLQCALLMRAEGAKRGAHIRPSPNAMDATRRAVHGGKLKRQASRFA